MIRVCHLTSVHTWTDTRIFYKECVSLVNNGYEVYLVAPNAAESIVEGVTIRSVENNSKSRLYRATILAFRVLRKGLKVKAKVYHFHDPELIWVGTILKLLGKKVVFDVHENIRAQIKMKSWLPMPNMLSKCYSIVDWWAAKLFYLVLADRSYEHIYAKLSKSYCVVENFPMTEKLAKFKVENRGDLDNGILYIGGVTIQRGILEIVSALAILKKRGIDFHFHCVGPMDDGTLHSIEELSGFQEVKEQITFYGPKPIYEAYELSMKCKVGLSILHPAENYYESLSTKIFEYMAVGLPFLVSNFPLYHFVNEEGLGLTVDPLSPIEIADSLEKIIKNKELASIIAQKGPEAVREFYSWNAQEKNLLNLYRQILKK